MSDYQQLLELYDQDLVQNSDEFRCPICFSQCAPGDGIVLKNCLHMFCRNCLSRKIKNHTSAEVKCPYSDTSYSCDGLLQDREIKSLVCDDVYKCYLELSEGGGLNKLENTYHCKADKCSGWCIYDDEDTLFLCPVCKQTNCLICQCIHAGLTCTEYHQYLKNKSEANVGSKRTINMLPEKRSCSDGAPVVQNGGNNIKRTQEQEILQLPGPSNMNDEQKLAAYRCQKKIRMALKEEQRLKINAEETKNRKVLNYQQLIELNNNGLVRNTDEFNCPICFCDYAAGDGIVLKDCLHTFCRDCLSRTITLNTNAQVKCPYGDANYSCDSLLQDREIRMLVDEQAYKRHLDRSITEAENRSANSFHCKTANCPGWCILEDDVNQFLCPVCNQTNCLTCQAIHAGYNCLEYQKRLETTSETNIIARKTNELIMKMLQKGDAMTCPTCGVVLMKKSGCDWLCCTMCATEICWVTRGPRWGPKGKGDTSQGCRCGIGGQKCHRQCNYCH